MSTIVGKGGTVLRVADAPGQTLRLRVVSAVLLTPVALLLIYLGGWPFGLAIALAGALMALEWARMTGGRNGDATAILQVTVTVLACLLATAGAHLYAVGLVLLAVPTLVLAAKATDRNVLWPALGAPWLALPCIAVIWLRGHPELGLELALWLFLLVWACDSAAYLFGRKIGGPRLAPRLSPKKTWAGLVAGSVAAAIVGAVAGLLTETVPAVVAAAISALIGGISQIGDLAESGVKRRFGVKDSGALIPGHGGILDRVDALLFAAPAAAMLLLLSVGWRPA